MRSPEQIDFREWHRLFREFSDKEIEETRYYRHLPSAEWSRYLFPPSTHVVYGNRLLKKLKFDNSKAALRLWGFVVSESERLFRAKQSGMKVIAVMGDLGAVTPLVHSFPNTIAFYPDCLWWTPFLMESRVLFEEAAQFGLGENCCFVRAALGAFSKKAYFPRPDLCIATVGATCDDMAAVISESDFLGNRIHYFELPHRHDSAAAQIALHDFISSQYRQTSPILEEVTGFKFSEERFRETIKKINRQRYLISECKRLCGEAEANPMSAIEMMNAEFTALSYYGDLDECVSALEDFHLEIKHRTEQNLGYRNQNVRLVWVTPPADPLLLNYVEDLGGRVVGSEYLINQSKPFLKMNSDPFETLAEAQLSSSLMGTTDFRLSLIRDEVKRSGAEGVIISGVFGSSHCAFETYPILDALRKDGLPVLAFDVVSPGKVKLQSQVFNRIEAFLESLKMRRERRAG